MGPGKNSLESKRTWGKVMYQLILNLGRTFTWSSVSRNEKREKPPRSISLDSFEVETSIVKFPGAETFDAPDGLLFLRHDGSPHTSPPRPGSSSSTTFQWIPRAVPSADSILDLEVKAKVERVIARCKLDEKEVTAQEAYDALRMANALEDEAVAYINRGEHIPSSADDDFEVKEFLQDLSIPAFTFKKKKRRKFT